MFEFIGAKSLSDLDLRTIYSVAGHAKNVSPLLSGPTFMLKPLSKKIPTDPWNIPQVPKKDKYGRISLIDRWLRVCSILTRVLLEFS